MRKLAFLFPLAFSPIAGCATNQRMQDVDFPITIGLLADSQITSQKGCLDYGYRSKLIDRRLCPVAVRPPALEYLAKDMLRVALERLSAEKNIDVILYLGDGANSGGADEVNDLIAVLEAHKTKDPNTPIFMVIGNHDYLGAGNTSNPIDRYILLNRPWEDPNRPHNQPLSKSDVLEKIREFNEKSGSSTFSYQDNCVKNPDCPLLDPNLDHDTGLYLAGHVTYSVPPKPTVQIYLADSSDYNNTPHKPKIEALKWEFYGLKGSMSSEDKKSSQISYFEGIPEPNCPYFRVMASHYHPDYFDRNRYTAKAPKGLIWRFENFLHEVWELCGSILCGHRYARHYLGPLLSDKGKNYWLSAHTHRESMTKPSQGRIGVGVFGLEGSFGSINIGSTTDHRAHVAVVERFRREEANNDSHVKKVDEHVQFREIPLFDYNKSLLKKIYKAIGDYGFAHSNDSNFVDFFNDLKKTKRKGVTCPDFIGMTILGLNKEYQEDPWLQKHTTASMKNLEQLIKKFTKDHKKEHDRADVVTCLAFIAGACEAKVCDYRKGFDLSKCDLK